MEVARLLEGNPKETGYLDPAAFDPTVDILLSGGLALVISRKAEGYWTPEV